MLAHYYIYYKVLSDDLETEHHIRNMQVRLACRSSHAGKLLKRRDDPLTWMEVYEDVSDSAAFEQHLARTLTEFDVAMFINGDRITECFMGDQPIAHCLA